MRSLIMALLITFFIDIPFVPSGVTQWMAVLLLAGTLTFILCLFLKENFYIIVTSIFFTYFAVSLFQLLSANKDDSIFKHPVSQTHSSPRIIHLVLDEHIGIEGIPADIDRGGATKSLITDFYLKNGFQLFGGAYSRYLYTSTSIGNALNFTAAPEPEAVMRGRGPYELVHNRYFKLLADKKYQIEVLSTGWVDFCSHPDVALVACTERHWSTLRNFAKLDVPVSQKVQVLYSRYLNQSSIVAAMIYVVVLPVQATSSALAPVISQWTWAFHPERAKLRFPRLLRETSRSVLNVR